MAHGDYSHDRLQLSSEFTLPPLHDLDPSRWKQESVMDEQVISICFLVRQWLGHNYRGCHNVVGSSEVNR